MAKVEIKKQVVTQGSFGISKINPTTGTHRGHVIAVWHVLKDGTRQNTFPTREDARNFIRSSNRRGY